MRLFPACLAIALLTCGFASWIQADDASRPPLYLMVGPERRSGSATHEVGPYGIYLGFGYVSDTSGLFQSGCAGVDLDYRRDRRNGRSLDSFEVMYTERVFDLAGGFYLGYGLGTGYSRLVRPNAEGGNGRGWRIAGKLMAGYSIADGLVLEGAYIRSGSVGGLDSSGFLLAAGLWF